MQPMKKYYIAMAILAAVSLGAIIWHYAISRGAASDERKVSDITTLQMAVDDYAQEKGTAPVSLNVLALEGAVTKRLSDYEYIPGDSSFTICTTFSTDASIDGSSYGSPDSPHWHKKGRQCFTSDILIYEYDDYDDSSDYQNELDYDSYYQQN